MTTLARLNVFLNADASGLQKTLKRAGKNLTTFRDSTLMLSGALKVLGGAAAAGFAAKKIFDVGAAVEETASKFRTVMGPSVREASAFLAEFANTAGLTRMAGQELLATTAAIAQGMGFTQTASAKFAMEITRLAGDLTSFSNIPIAETSRAIQAALTGERESLKRLGIVILDADVKTKALAMSGGDAVKAATQQARAAATLQLITERAGVAIGDLGRTMDSPANKARKLAARFGDIRDGLAHAMLPAMGVVLEELGNLGGPQGFDGLTEKLRNNGNRIVAWARFAIEAFKTVGKAIALPIRLAFNLGQIIGDSLVLAFLKARRAFNENLNEWRSALNSFIEGLNRLPGVDIDFRFAGENVDELTAGIDERMASIRGNLADMGDAFTDIAGGFERMLTASDIAWKTMQDDVAPAAAAVTSAMAEVAEATFDAKAATDAAARANARMKRLMDDQRASLAVLRTPMDDYIEQVGLLELVLSRGGMSTDQFTAALTVLRDNLARATGAMKTTMESLRESMEHVALAGIDAFAGLATDGADAMRRFVKSALADLARLLARLLIVRGLMALLPGSSFVSGLASAAGLTKRASGGPVSANQAYLVGERGPELFVPSTAGNVTANHQMGQPFVFDFSGMPPARNWLESTRDHEWQRFLRESNRVAAAQGA